MKGLVIGALALTMAGGCFRLSDPFYAFQELQAEPPSRDGVSLLLGTIAVDHWAAGGLDSVTLVRLGPGAERKSYGANRLNLFRAFTHRSLKNRDFIIEVDPGIYELDSFSTGGWGGRPQIWRARDDARRVTRFIVTRPGVYDIGTIHVARGESLWSGFGLERVADPNPARQEIFARALAGTRWEQMSAPVPAPGGEARTANAAVTAPP